MSKEEENEEQRAAPLEPVSSIFDLFQAPQSAVEFKKAKTEKLAPRVIIPIMEPSKKWRKLPYSPQWVSMLDVAQKILDEEDRMKKEQKENKREGEGIQAHQNIGVGKVETEEEQMSASCGPHFNGQPTTVQDLQPLLEQLPSPGTSSLSAEEEILTANEIEGIIQEIVALRAKEKLSEEVMPPEGIEKFFSQDVSSISTLNPYYHRDHRIPH